MGVNWDKGICKGAGDTYTRLGLYVDLADRRSAILIFAVGPKVRGSLLVLPLVLTGLYQKDTTTTDNLYRTLWTLLAGTLAVAMPSFLRHYQLRGTTKLSVSLAKRQ